MINTELLREVILENREEVMRHMVVPRDINIDGFDRMVLVGVRRAGKSYLLYDKIQRFIHEDGRSWDEIVYLNFEDERLSGMEMEDLNKILEVFGSLSSKRPMLFLDEVQNVDGWSKFLRRLADSKYTIYVTGSNAQMLSTDIEKELGGRFISKEIYPYSYQEFLRANGIDSLSPNFRATTMSRSEETSLRKEFMEYGGFPEVTDTIVKRDYLSSLYQKIFLGDIATRHSIENIFGLRMLYRKLVESVGQPLSFNRARNILKASGMNISVDTVIKYLQYAKEACLVYCTGNYNAALSQKESNMKYYFVDNGILSLFANDVNVARFENVVAVHLFRRYGSHSSVFYYQNGIEVDFVVPDEEMAVQACYNFETSTSTAEREIRALVKLNQRIPQKRNIIVTNDDDRRELMMEGIKIEIMPLVSFLLEQGSVK